MFTVSPDCGTNKTIANGIIDFSTADTTYGSTVEVTCNTGFALAGGTVIECLANGIWDNTVTCQIKGIIPGGPGSNPARSRHVAV